MTTTPPVRRENLAASGLVSLAGSAFGAVAAMGLTLVVGRGAGAGATGMFFQAIGLFTILTQVLKLGTNSGLVRGMAQDRAHGRHGYELRTVLLALVPVVAVSAVASLGLYAGASWVATVAAAPDEVDGLAACLRALAPFVACAAVLGVAQSATRMVNSVTAFIVLQNVLLPLSRMGAVLFAILGAGTVGSLVLAWAVPLPVWLVVTVALLAGPLRADRRRRSGPATPLRQDVRRFWSYTGPRGLGASLEVCLDWIDVLVVAALAGPVEAGVYAVITRTVRAGQVVDRAMRVSVSPRISHLLALDQLAAARTLHTRVARAMVLGTWPFYLTLATMGPAVLGLFGDEFRTGAPVLALYSAVMMAAATAGMLQSVLLMGGHSSWQVWLKGLAVALSVIGNLALVPIWGMAGAAATWAVVVAVDSTVAAALVHCRMRVAVDLRAVLSVAWAPVLVFGAGGLALRAVLGAELIGLLVLLLGGGAFYTWLLWRHRMRLGTLLVWEVLAARVRFRRPDRA